MGFGTALGGFGTSSVRFWTALMGFGTSRGGVLNFVGGVWDLAGGVFFVDGASLVSSPAGADLLSLSCQRKVSKERRARDGDFPLNLCRREGKEPNSLRSDRAPSFFLPATEIQGAI